MEPTIYKPSIYKGPTIYKTGAGGGGGGSFDFLWPISPKKYIENTGFLKFVVNKQILYNDKITAVFKASTDYLSTSYGIDLISASFKNWQRKLNVALYGYNTNVPGQMGVQVQWYTDTNTGSLQRKGNGKVLLFERQGSSILFADNITIGVGVNEDTIGVSRNSPEFTCDFFELFTNRTQSNAIKVKLYYLAISSVSDELKNLFVPDEQGLKDLVDDSVYTPTGTGTFTIGED